MTGVVPPPDMRPQSWQQFSSCAARFRISRATCRSQRRDAGDRPAAGDIVPGRAGPMEGRRVVQFNKTTLRTLA